VRSSSPVKSLQQQIESIVQRCLVGIDAGAECFNVIEQLAKPMPAIVIAEMIVHCSWHRCLQRKA
jgi:cytochrome P450